MGCENNFIYSSRFNYSIKWNKNINNFQHFCCFIHPVYFFFRIIRICNVTEMCVLEAVKHSRNARYRWNKSSPLSMHAHHYMWSNVTDTAATNRTCPYLCNISSHVSQPAPGMQMKVNWNGCEMWAQQHQTVSADARAIFNLSPSRISASTHIKCY